MIKSRFKLLAMLLVLSLVFFLSACDDAPPVKEKEKSSIVKKKIPAQPAAAEQKQNSVLPVQPETAAKPNSAPEAGKALNPPGAAKESKQKAAADPPSDKMSETAVLFGLQQDENTKHYESQGKIDPFKPLIQDQKEESQTVEDNRPKRILTPLEKIELSQIRLVAVIQMKNKQIAMVEEASGKGYEVTIGTYIGKNEGRITEIKSDRIIVKELVKDFRGRLKEREQEIKLNKNSDEG